MLECVRYRFLRNVHCQKKQSTAQTRLDYPMETYKQKVKNRVRNEVLTYAIRALTTKRTNSTIASPTQLHDVALNVLREYPQSNIVYSLKDDTVKRWEKFYQASIGSKKRSELRIAYLCGPEPNNDLEVMLKSGVLPENIWAFENDENCFGSAKQQVLSSKYPYLKIVKRNIKEFFQTTSIVFDIIYLDFCSTLIDKNNIETITTLFDCHVLAPLGVLITNFSLSEIKQNVDTYKKIVSFTSNYLYHKEWLEVGYRQPGFFSEGAISSGFSCPECDEKCLSIISEDKTDELRKDCFPFNRTVLKKTEEYYGQCITRFLMDIPSTIIPSQRLFGFQNVTSSILGENKELKTLFDNYIKDYYGPDGVFSLEKLYEMLCDDNDWTGKTIYNLKTKYYNTFDNLLSSINISSKKYETDKLIKHLFLHELLVFENGSDNCFIKTPLFELNKHWSKATKTGYHFCDVFLFHQILEVLLAQIAVPYFPKIDQIKRWTYKAKEHRMFTDLFVFDQARYIMDWLPTPEMISDLNFDLQVELSIRFLLDAFAKNNYCYLTNLFFGCNVIPCTDQNVKFLSKRKHLFSR